MSRAIGGFPAVDPLRLHDQGSDASHPVDVATCQNVFRSARRAWTGPSLRPETAFACLKGTVRHTPKGLSAGNRPGETEMTKRRKSVPITQTVIVDPRDANVMVQNVDCQAIGGSFKVHLFRNDQRIASRFFLQASDRPTDRYANFDFVVPLETVARARLRVEIERAEPGSDLWSGDVGAPELSVCLMLE